MGHGAELKRKTSRLGQNQEAWQIAKRAGQTRIANYIQQCMKDKEKLGTTRAQLEGGTRTTVACFIFFFVIFAFCDNNLNM